MEFVHGRRFGRIVERYRGDAGVRTLGCAEVFRIMASRNSPARVAARHRDCMHQPGKLFTLTEVAAGRSTLADALNLRDWRIYRALAGR